MPVGITCPHCGRALRLPDALYERPAQCPICDGAFAVIWHQRAAAKREAAQPSAPREAAALKPCVFCAELIKQQATRCPHCGRQQDTSSPSADPPSSPAAAPPQ
jgi:hypothetical protein